MTKIDKKDKTRDNRFQELGQNNRNTVCEASYSIIHIY